MEEMARRAARADFSARPCRTRLEARKYRVIIPGMATSSREEKPKSAASSSPSISRISEKTARPPCSPRAKASASSLTE